MKNLLQKYYLKIRIVITFCVVTFLLVLIMSQISYHYSRDSYLTQVSTHARSIVGIMAKQIDKNYTSLLRIGTSGKALNDYFRNQIGKFNQDLQFADFFIFDDSFKILVHSTSNDLYKKPEPRLLLHQSEILELNLHSSTATLPFKGNDDNWYLWAFYRLDENLWLGMQESANQLQKVEDLFLLFWYLGLGGMALTVILGLFVAASITKPIDRLTTFSVNIGKGDFNTQPPDKIKGELKILADAMDKMRSDISNNHKEKEEMLAQIAHEIRNPLGSIELMANLTKEDILAGKNSTEYLNKILLEISDLKSLITAYLNYSRPYLAKPEKVDLNHLVNEISSLFNAQFAKKNIQFETNIQSDKIYFDSGHLKQILINLISNSIDSIGENGKISVKSESNKDKFIIKITDTGKGISKENLEYIFTPFFTTKSNGTGLGLAICKKLCQQNNTTIQLGNNSEDSCEFIITMRSFNDA